MVVSTITHGDYLEWGLGVLNIPTGKQNTSKLLHMTSMIIIEIIDLMYVKKKWNLEVLNE